MVLTDRITLVFRTAVTILLFLIAISSFTFAVYIPYFNIRNIGYTAIRYIDSFELGLVAIDEFRIQASLTSTLYCLFPIACIAVSILLLKRSRMSVLPTVGLICGAYSFLAIVTITVLMWSNFEFLRYESGIEVIIGWIFHFVAIT